MKKPFTQFRPHHFLCAVGFVGKGYSDPFVKNFSQIVENLRGSMGDQLTIEVIQHTDSVCAPCPHKQNKLCANQEKIEKLDAAHANTLEIQPGDVLTWKEAKTRIIQKISLDTFNDICAPCDWKAMGMCEKALKNMRENTI